ncbi:hypothetical protein ACFVW2_37670, partial [Streptomyces sp. NPDC058171]
SCYLVVLSEAGADDYGSTLTLVVEAMAPSGRTTTALRGQVHVEGPVYFMIVPFTIPVEPGGGRHVYSVRIEGREETVAFALDVDDPSAERAE